MTTEERTKAMMRVSWITVLVNLLLSVLKLVAGIVAHSGAMLSDAVHSASDVLSTFGVMIGTKLSGRKADESHPYGHERLECIASIFLAIFLAAAGGSIGYNGIETLIRAKETPIVIPGVLALIAAVLSIVTKEGMYWYTVKAAKTLSSPALQADAWHHRSDALSSVGSLIGIAGARLGFPMLDPIASVVICLFIFKAAYDIFAMAIQGLTDHSVSPAMEQQLRESMLAEEGVMGIDLLRTRQFGAFFYVDAELSVDGNLPLVEAHEIAHRVHDHVESTFPKVKHCMIHLNPGNTK